MLFWMFTYEHIQAECSLLFQNNNKKKPRNVQKRMLRGLSGAFLRGKRHLAGVKSGRGTLNTTNTTIVPLIGQQLHDS